MTKDSCTVSQPDIILFIKKLEPPRPCFRPRTNISTYSSENPSAKQPVGDFDMPMSLMDISKSEDLNDVQVNVFR